MKGRMIPDGGNKTGPETQDPENTVPGHRRDVCAQLSWPGGAEQDGAPGGACERRNSQTLRGQLPAVGCQLLSQGVGESGDSIPRLSK